MIVTNSIRYKVNLMNKISIIVPVYNVESYLHYCVKSVLAQTYSNWELILVNDGSPDRCPQICDEYAEMDYRIKVIHKANGGLSSARNAALDIAKGDFITFLDSDDYLHQDTLSDVIKIVSEEDIDIVQFSFIRGTSNIFPAIKKNTKKKFYDNHTIFYSNIQKIILCGKFYRRSIWDGIRMPIGKINEDDATTWKLYYRSKKIVYINTPYYYYRVNPTSIMSNQRKLLKLDFIEHYQERISFFENRGEKLLTDLSKWRFCLPLMLGYMRGNVRKDDLTVLLKHFKENYKAVIFCRKVNFKHRLLIATFNLCPQFFRWVFIKLGKAHTIY